ncbi:hypothetical protein ZEAMMB73_Zm00001d046520 [Zea mays]|uniref:Uncharacterized protein n=1 Tax=Zea mays TaxID=4577 RepID=K7VEW8_MAIZE|nr:hypothetical protein ZEAMMB73_Zm00001d046520 [Zea mays]
MLIPTIPAAAAGAQRRFAAPASTASLNSSTANSRNWSRESSASSSSPAARSAASTQTRGDGEGTQRRTSGTDALSSE